MFMYVYWTIAVAGLDFDTVVERSLFTGADCYVWDFATKALYWRECIAGLNVICYFVTQNCFHCTVWSNIK